MGVDSLISQHDDSIIQLEKKISNLERQLSLHEEFFDGVPYLITIVKIDGTILYVNQAMSESLGKDKNELIGTNILDFFPKEIRYHRLKKSQQVVQTRRPVEFIDVRKNRYFKSTYFPIIEKEGKINRIVAIVQDITIEKLKEKQELKNKEEYFESLIKNSLDLITVVNRKGKILYESRSLKNILQYSPESRINKSVFDHIHPKDKNRVKTFFSSVISKPGLTKKITFRVKDKNDKWHHFESLGNNQLDNKKIRGLIINSRDITHRINEQMEKNAILDNTSEIIAFHDKHHQIVWANKAYQRETRLDLDKLIGKKCYHAWGLDTTCNHCPLSVALKTGKTSEAIFSPENQKNWPSDFKTWRIIGDPVFNEDGEIIGAIELSYDITEQKQAEEEMKRTKDHLEKLIHNTSEIIFSINHQFIITLWNKTAEKLSGIKANKIVGKDIRKQQFIENKDELITFLKRQLAHKPASLNQIKLKTLFGSRRLLKVSTSFVADEENVITDMMFICQDITTKDQVHGQLMQGLSYIIDDTNVNRLITIFNDFLSEERKGLFIGRSRYDQIISHLNVDYVTLAILSDRTVDFAPTINDLIQLKSFVNTFVQKHTSCIICLDRIDYLFTTFGFQKTLSMLYDINDLIQKYQAILLMRVNINLFKENEYEILKEEFSQLPSSQIKDVYLDDVLFSLLSYIHDQNQVNVKVYQKSITHFFKISKVTAQKRLDVLRNNELIFYKKQGRINQFFITDKGKQLLQKSGRI